MKKKMISILMLIALIVPIFGFNKEVFAYSGEIDPQNYIILGDMDLNLNTKIATGTISLSTNASGYSISYQKVDITQTTANNIQTKANEADQYVTTSNNEIKKMEANVADLESEYDDLADSDEATEEEIAAAKKKYDDAVEEYNSYVSNAKQKIQTLQNEIYALVPDYTSSWQATTNTTNNVKLDFSNYSGTINFVLWAKIENGTNTYYRFKIYSNEIKKEENQQPRGGGETTTGDWTDFSNAKYELKKDGATQALVEASGVTGKTDSRYWIYFSNTSEEPNLTDIKTEEKILFEYDQNDGKFKTTDIAAVAKFVEYNKDLYVNVIEHNKSGSDKIVASGKKVERFAEPKYSDAFSGTLLSYNNSQIITSFTHSSSNDRKMQIKVGKITDTTILNKIKNQDASGFSDLLNYSKSNTGIFDQTLNADQDKSIIQYTAGGIANEANEVINLSGLEDGAYYYLYVQTEDENGKYISNEAVTLAQAKVYTDLNNEWYMFFYGSDNFKWADFGNIPTDGENTTTGGTDDTIAPIAIPKAGLEKIIFIGIGIMIIGAGITSYKKYKKYQGI